MKSPFLYPGSKGKASDLKQIRLLIPEHQVYYEPFVGSGSIFLNNTRTPSEINLSDINTDLITCYKSIQSHSEAICGLLPDWNPIDVSEEQYRGYWNAQKNNKSDILSDIGARFIFLNRTSFQGLGGILAQKDTRYNPKIIKNRIIEMGLKLKNATLRCISAIEAIKNDILNDEAFFFLDPPYIGSNNKACYKHDSWKESDLRELESMLSGSKAKWLLTHENTELIRDIFGRYNSFEYNWRKMKVGGDEDSSEIYIANYDIRSIISAKYIDLYDMD